MNRGFVVLPKNSSQNFGRICDLDVKYPPGKFNYLFVDRKKWHIIVKPIQIEKLHT